MRSMSALSDWRPIFTREVLQASHAAQPVEGEVKAREVWNRDLGAIGLGGFVGTSISEFVVNVTLLVALAGYMLFIEPVIVDPTLAAVYPANIHMAVNSKDVPKIPAAALWARLPVQGLFGLLTWRGTR